MRRIGRWTLSIAVLQCGLVSIAAAQTVVFDFDAGAPTLFAGQGVPLEQTAGGITGHFSSPQGPAFSVQNDGTTFQRMTRFSGNYLWPDSIDRNGLIISFSQPLVGITMTFATVDYQDNAEIPANLQLTAFDNSTGALVGTASAVSRAVPGSPEDRGRLKIRPREADQLGMWATCC